MRTPTQRWADAVLAATRVLYPWPLGNGKGLTPEQRVTLQDMLRLPVRFPLILGGERAGKSFLIAVWAALLACPYDGETGEEVRGEAYWLVGPDYLQARPEYTYLKEIFDALGLVESVSEPKSETQPWTLTLKTGTTFSTRSSGNVARLASFSVNGAIMCEAAQQNYAVYLKLRGRVSQTRGFLGLSGTLEKGLPWYSSMYKKWQRGHEDITGWSKSYSLPTWSNLAAYPQGEDDPEILSLKDSYPDDIFLERFAAVPRQKHGLVVPEFDAPTHIKTVVWCEDDEDAENLTPDQVPFFVNAPVDMAYDPGKHCAALWFLQRQGRMTMVLDAVYIRNILVQDFIPEAQKSPFWQFLSSKSSNVADRAVFQEHHNKSVASVWHEETGVQWVASVIKDEAVLWETLRWRLTDKNTLSAPLIYFSDTLPYPEIDEVTGLAPHALTEFDAWRWPERQDDAMRNESKRPVDRNNDALKALAYHQVYHYGRQEYIAPVKTVTRSYVNLWN